MKIQIIIAFILSTVALSSTHDTEPQRRLLQWGSQYPHFSSLLSAADFTTASVSSDSIAVSSEGTRSVMNLQNGDWMRYSLGIPEAGVYLLSMRVAVSQAGGAFHIVQVDSRAALATVSDLPVTSDWTTVSTNITLPVGLHLLEVQVDQGGWSLQWLNLLPVNLVPEVARGNSPVPTLLTLAPLAAPVVSPVPLAPAVAPVIPPVATPVVSSTPTVTPPVTPGFLPAVTTPDGCLFQVDAPNYASMSGVGYEEGTDYIGWLDSGDWIVYKVALPPGTYQLDTVLASPDGLGSFEMLDSMTQTPLMFVDNFPATGDWNTWQVVSTVFQIPTTSTTPFALELKITSGNWNLQSLCFRETTAVAAPFFSPGPLSSMAPSLSMAPSESPVRPPHDCSSPF